MLKSFFKNYFELPSSGKKIVCLGGGVGTATILKGLKYSNFDLTAIVSMADDGGSAGRLRRAFSVPPPGDLVNCLAALSQEESVIKQLFLYRFKGERYGRDMELGGQKLGNLIFVALCDIYKGNTSRAVEEFSKIISSKGRVLPATIGDVNIWAVTEDGAKVVGEENIDLGNYNSKSRSLKEVHLDPPNIKAYRESLLAIEAANLLIIGPGDLFSTVLPVLIVPQIKELLEHSKAKKVFIANITNKPFETAHFSVSNYLKIFEKQIPELKFDKIIINVNQKSKIPQNLNYLYVKFDESKLKNYQDQIITGDFVNSSYPLYHDSAKIAKAIENIVKQ